MAGLDFYEFGGSGSVAKSGFVAAISPSGGGEGGGGPEPDVTPPDTPANLSATAGDLQVILDWDDNTEPDLNGYQYRYRTTVGPGSWSSWGNVTPSTKTVTGLTNGTSYDFEVRAYDNVPNYSSAASTEVVPEPDYVARSLAQNPAYLWALDEVSGTNAADVGVGL
jgi:hypothetical protein